MTNIEEIWKPVVGYEGIYEVSDLGRIKRVLPARGTRVGHILTPCKGKKGYLTTRLVDKNGKCSSVKFHRIVCKAFHPNPLNLPQVNHKDTDKANNRANNLEWCTNEHNVKHKVENGLSAKIYLGKFGADHNKSIPIRCVNIDTGKEKVIVGINEAARQLKTNSTAIWRVLSGEWRHTKRWTFARINH